MYNVNTKKKFFFLVEEKTNFVENIESNLPITDVNMLEQTNVLQEKNEPQ